MEFQYRDMAELILRANAKINLFLEVGGRREDGYHDIVSVMQSVSLADEVSVRTEADADAGIRLDCGELPGDERNIAYRAAEMFYSEVGISPRADIVIRKQIPVAAGLAGGSTDGAAVLYALERMYGNPLGLSRLTACAARLGADVPFCLFGGAMLAEGIGERLSPCTPLPDCTVLIAKRSEGVLTAGAFGALDRLRGGSGFSLRKPQGMLDAVAGGSLRDIGEELYNAFEALPYAETLGTHRIRKICRAFGGYALLSGSGPSVFALFEQRDAADNAARSLRSEYSDISVFLCSPVKSNFGLNGN